MIYQRTPYSCGPAALNNAMIALGLDPSPNRVEFECGTTDEGTHERDLKKGIVAMELDYEELAFNDPDISWQWLVGALALGFPVVIYVGSEDHWATAFGLIGELINVFDPDIESSGHCNGIYTMDKAETLSWWISETEPVQFYALAIKRLA